jgi:hypothetical protein
MFNVVAMSYLTIFMEACKRKTYIKSIDDSLPRSEQVSNLIASFLWYWENSHVDIYAI